MINGSVVKLFVCLGWIRSSTSVYIGKEYSYYTIRILITLSLNNNYWMSDTINLNLVFIGKGIFKLNNLLIFKIF